MQRLTFNCHMSMSRTNVYNLKYEKKKLFAVDLTIHALQNLIVFTFLPVLGKHPWLLSEPDTGVEVPIPGSDSQTDRTLLQGPIPGEYNFSLRTVT